MTTIAADLCVYSGSPAGLSCAIRAAREGLSVVVVTHTPHLGGMLTSGLCVWDTQWEGRRAPIYDQWRQAFFDHYQETYGHRSPEYMAALPGPRGYSNGNFEPKVAREIVERLVGDEARIRVERRAIPVAVHSEGRRIAAVEFERLGGEGSFTVEAAAFADGSYEGDPHGQWPAAPTTPAARGVTSTASPTPDGYSNAGWRSRRRSWPAWAR